MAKTDRLVYILSNLQCWDFHNPSLYDKRSIDRNFLEVNPADYVCHNIQHLPILFLQSVSTILKPYLFVEDRKVPADCHASGHQQFLFVLFVITQLIMTGIMVVTLAAGLGCYVGLTNKIKNLEV